MSSKKRRREEKKKKRKVRFVFGRGIINGVKLIALSLSLSLETGIGDIFLIHERLMRASNRVVLSFPVAGERW